MEDAKESSDLQPAGTEADEATFQQPLSSGTSTNADLSNTYSNIVRLDGDADPLDPQNWPATKKLYTAVLLGLATMIAALTSSIFSTIIPALMVIYGISREVGTLGVSLYVLGFATGPIIWAPFSEVKGRRAPFLLAMFGFTVFAFATAVSKDLQSIFICRFFTGFFGAGPLTLSGAVYGDILAPQIRGAGMVGFCLMVFVGPLLAPTIGGFIIMNDSLGWRWTQYIPGILGAASFISLLLFHDETYVPVLLSNKAARLRQETKDWSIHAEHDELDINFNSIFHNYLALPLKMLALDPIILCMCIFGAFVYGLLYLFLTAYPIIFQQIYGMTPGVGGLPFIGVVVGQLLAGATMFLGSPRVGRQIKANGGQMVPEWLLPMAIPGSVAFSAGLFWLGWTGYRGDFHWIVPTASGLLTGFGLLGMFLPSISYVAEARRKRAASAIAAHTFLRSLAGAIFPLFATYMFDGLGVEWACTLLGCVAALLIPMPIIFYIYGARIRARTHNQPRSKARLNKSRHSRKTLPRRPALFDTRWVAPSSVKLRRALWDRFRHRESRSDDGSTTSKGTRSEANEFAKEDSKERTTYSTVSEDHCSETTPRDFSTKRRSVSSHRPPSQVDDPGSGGITTESTSIIPSTEEHRDKEIPRDLWKEAFEALLPATQSHLRKLGYEPDASKTPHAQDLDILVQDLCEKRDICEKGGWKYKSENHELIVRDSAAKCATLIPVKFTEQVLALLGTVERVLQVTHSGRVYEFIYATETGDIVETLGQDLVKVYQAVQELLSHAIEMFSKSTWTRILAGIFDKTSELFSDLAAKEEELARTAHAPVIDHVQDTLAAVSNNEGFAYFYCNKNEDARTRPLAVAQSYVRQLSSSAKSSLGYIQSKFQTSYNELRLRGKGFNLEHCRTSLIESLNLYPRTTIVLDAFDECDPASREDLIELFEALLSASKRPIKLLIASRPDGDIRREFRSRPNIEIQETDNRDDIPAYICQIIPKLVTKNSAIEGLEPEITRALLEGCQGIFQWVFLQLEQLGTCISREDILDSLGKLPRTLDEMYGQLYEEISNGMPHDFILAQRAVMWVLAAREPLSREDLPEAIHINPDLDSADMCTVISEDALLSLCRNLLVIDSEQNVWRVSHLSVAEYFKSRHGWTDGVINTMVSKSCLLFLLSETFYLEYPISRRRKPNKSVFKRPLLYYITYHWPEHVSPSEQSRISEVDLSTVTALLERFLGAPQASNAQYRKWAWVRYLEPVENSILAVCEYGFNRVLSQWWEMAELDHTLINSAHRTYMMVAAREGHVAILRLLLQKGGTTGIQGFSHSYSTPLMEAASGGHIEAARALLGEGNVDINLQVRRNGPDSCALDSALSTHSPNMLSMVRFLVSESQADVNMQLWHSGFGSVFAKSAAFGLPEVAKYLVEEGGADVDLVLQHGNYGSALACAVSYGHNYSHRGEILDYLVRIRRANVDLLLQTGHYGSALAAAASKGEMEFVR
ncbi:synaptic vesicle transporter [Aspergillus affinis]|uniref:synaptic vesicle transporter n=1 Tax=Aspergillus affinis TaxID=1070780 RepID=UPI0022FEE88B|nr:synaptic vesicle transporter [Aspergillus affinis]KAI9040701.1 synaptic vesicle transporter [Aspergillus affinis]